MANFYSAHPASLQQHPLPAWFEDAKLGLMIAWGLFSIPAFAPTGITSNALISRLGWQEYFRRTPYAEWYANAIRLPNTPARRYHEQQFGAQYNYTQFAAIFQRSLHTWSAQPWAELFAQSGARYVIAWAKFHDGFLLWPSAHRPPQANWFSQRNILAELAQAVRQRGLRFGIYYSGALDWAFGGPPIRDLVDLLTSGPATPAYGRYVDAHYRELIQTLRPDVLWNDIGYPPQGQRDAVLAEYYNAQPEGCINDRWLQYGRWMHLTRLPPLRTLVNTAGRRAMRAGQTGAPLRVHADFLTPEFTTFDHISRKKFEVVLSFGTSVGYNAQEDEKDLLSSEAMIHRFCDILSKNGNLLLVVAPKADGSIPAAIEQRLIELGSWVRKNAPAIFGTRPWKISQSLSAEGIPIRYTVSTQALYLFLLGQPRAPLLSIPGLTLRPGSIVQQLGQARPLHWQQQGGNLQVTLPCPLPPEPAYVFAISPQP